MLQSQHCTGDGMCLAQIDFDDYEQEYDCKYKCEPQKCSVPSCQNMIPQCILFCHNNRCTNCGIEGYWIQKKWKGPGYCLLCKSNRKLPSIGSSRLNGCDHSDWNG